VPDLFAVFARDTFRCNAVIEVKTTESEVLSFKNDYIAKLQAYADLVGEPLLIAWRPRRIGFWILFDPNCARRPGAIETRAQEEYVLNVAPVRK